MGDELDRYYTDPLLARAILLTLSLTTSFPKTIRVAEPCAGDGVFLSQAGALGWEPVGGCDVDPDSPAVLNGSVNAPLLSIEEGVLFNGTLEMSKPEQAAQTLQGTGSVTPIRVSSTMRTM